MNDVEIENTINMLVDRVKIQGERIRNLNKDIVALRGDIKSLNTTLYAIIKTPVGHTSRADDCVNCPHNNTEDVDLYRYTCLDCGAVLNYGSDR